MTEMSDIDGMNVQHHECYPCRFISLLPLQEKRPGEETEAIGHAHQMAYGTGHLECLASCICALSHLQVPCFCRDVDIALLQICVC